MKAIVFFRKNGRPDSRTIENDKEFDNVVKHIEFENEGADIVGIMDYKAAGEWVQERLNSAAPYGAAKEQAI